LKLTCIGRIGSRNHRIRLYTLLPPDDGREAIFALWQQRDFSKHDSCVESVSRVSNINLIVPSVDTKTEVDHQSINLSPGTIVRWLRQTGKWIVKATTGVIAQIINEKGQEFLVNCQELRLCYEEEK
jgi:hypothetical protein